MHHQLQRCAGYTLLYSTFPELALFRIFACIQHQIPVGLFASLGDTDRYYLPLFFYPDRCYKHPNYDEKHSKCNFKPAKEAIRLQKKILLCKSTLLFHLHLLSGKSNASFTKSGFYPNTRKRNSLHGSALKTVLNDQCGSVRKVLSVRHRQPRFARPPIGVRRDRLSDGTLG